MVEAHALGHDVVGAALGRRVARAVEEGGVGKVEGILLAQPLGLGLHHLLRRGHQVLHHRGAELLHVLLGVAVAAHAVVAQLHVVVVAHLPGLAGADLDQLVIEGVQLLPVLQVEAALRLPGGPAAVIVRILLEGGQLGQGVHAALKGDLGGGNELSVVQRQGVLPLHQGHDGGDEGLELQLHVSQEQPAVLRLKVRPEGGGEQGLLEFLLRLPQQGQVLGHEAGLLVIVGVPGVDGVADIGQGVRGVEMAVQLLHLQEGGPGLLIGFRPVQRLRAAADGGLGGLQVGAGIGHIGKFHFLSLLSVGPPLRATDGPDSILGHKRPFGKDYFSARRPKHAQKTAPVRLDRGGNRDLEITWRKPRRWRRRCGPRRSSWPE